MSIMFKQYDSVAYGLPLLLSFDFNILEPKTPIVNFM